MSLNLCENKDNQDNKDAIGKITGFFLFRNLIENYNKNRELSGRERDKIKRYGVISVILSTLSIIVSISCLITTLLNVEFEGVSVILIVIVSVLGGIVIPFILSMYAFVFAVMQVRLNRKSIGIIGIVLSVFSVVSCIVLAAILII